jgi:hypothetical protein
MKATLKYASGWKLTVDAQSLAPRLFLEWVSQYHKSSKASVQIKVSMSEQEDTPLFIIEAHHATRETMTELRDFINANM